MACGLGSFDGRVAVSHLFARRAFFYSISIEIFCKIVTSAKYGSTEMHARLVYFVSEGKEEKWRVSCTRVSVESIFSDV